ncbi:MAG TPA: DEAD/DEAH box helicase [Bacteroidia bacterium]|nr:DEAD/DEAH box helicase [Bacteroidia bacterium]
MQFTPRPYQADAIHHAVNYFNGSGNYNAFEILPTGSGKSVVIANIAKELRGKTVVFQPSKEILAQNVQKFTSYGYRAGVYSASAGKKYLDKITFSTIGSVTTKHHLFRDCENIIIDECHLVNGKGGMYHDFVKAIPGAKVLGLTATPYRLSSSLEGAMLKFINRTNPRIFNKCIYYVQNRVLFDSGHLARLEYFSFNVIDRKMLQVNSTGTDFTDASLKEHYRKINMPQITIGYANRLLAKRKNLLVFCSLIAEAKEVASGIPGAVVITGETDKAMRDRVLAQFKSGRIRCVINVGVLTTGFDYPELECVLLARSTMSLALYYQIFGRGMRIHPSKESCWLVDLGGNINFFGKIETMTIRVNEKGLYSIWNNGRQLTNVTFTKN